MQKADVQDRTVHQRGTTKEIRASRIIVEKLVTHIERLGQCADYSSIRGLEQRSGGERCIITRTA